MTANDVGTQGDPGFDEEYERQMCGKAANASGYREVVIDNVGFLLKESK